MELISIIIPVYNLAPYLPRALESALGQRYRNVEVVVVDDGSTDESAAIVRSFADRDQRVRLITQSNQGVMKARQVGIEASQGDYLLFLDGDDYLTREGIGGLYEALQRNDWDIVAGDYYRNGPSYQLECRENWTGTVVGEQYLKLQLTGEATSFLWGKLFTRDIFAGLHFPQEMTVWEDKYLNLQIAANGVRVGHVPIFVSHYVKRPGSASYRPMPLSYLVSFYRYADPFLLSRFPDMQPWMVLAKTRTYLLFINSSKNRLASRDPWIAELYRQMREPAAARLIAQYLTPSDKLNILLHKKPYTIPIAKVITTFRRLGKSVRKRMGVSGKTTPVLN